MGHLSWQELEQRQIAASTAVSIGSLWPSESVANAHEVIGHCIIEATDEVGVLHRPIGHHDPVMVDPLTLPSDNKHRADRDLDDMAIQCRLAALKVPTGSVWEHTKTRGTYQILGRCVLNGLTLPETGILYHAVSHPRVTFARPLSNWLGLVEYEGKQVLRFQELA